MKKYKTAILCVLFVGAIAGIVIHMRLKDAAMLRETADFAVDTVLAISDGWNSQALVVRAEPGLIKAMSSKGQQSVDDLFDIYRTLGGIMRTPDCRYKDRSEFNGVNDYYQTVTYTCSVDYTNGPATILITLRQGQTQPDWKIYYINISSPHFTEEGYQRTK